MERLTPNIETAYPVKRGIMETSEQGDARPNNRVNNLKESDWQRKESERGETRGKASLGDGIFSNFSSEQFRHNRSLEELAQMVKAAGRRNEVSEAFLQDINQQLFRRVQLGMVSDNESRVFGQALNAAVVQSLEKGSAGRIPDNDYEKLALEIKEIIEKRRREGITSDDVESIRAILEKTYGRELTPLELQRAMFGIKSMEKGSESKEFEAQVSLIESITKSPKKIDDFMRSVDAMTVDEVRNAMSGMSGKVALEIVMGDISDGRENYHERLAELLGGDVRNLKEGLKILVRDIGVQEKREAPQRADEFSVRAAKKQAEEFIKDARKRRDVSAEEVDEIMKRAERSVPVIAGGADYGEHFEALKEGASGISDEISEEEFRIRKANLVGHDFIDNILVEIYGQDMERIRLEREKINALQDIETHGEFKREYGRMISGLESAYQRQLNNPSSNAENEQEARRMADEIARRGETRTKSGRSFGDVEHVDYDFFNRKPKNVLDVAAWIVSSDDSRTWGPDGKYPIFTRHPSEKITVLKRNRITGQIGPVEVAAPVFQEGNFIRWIRNKALEHHSDNPNDPINLLAGINIETLFSPVSILTMKYNKQQYFSDEEGNLLSNLADEAINEAWFFGVRRNRDLAYKQVMTRDDKLFEAIVEMSAKNEHTSASNLADLLRMGEEFSDEDGNKDNRVGDAVLAANQIYRNLSDIHRLYQILPHTAPIFTIEGFRKAALILNNQDYSEEPKGYGNLFIEGKKNVYFRDPRTGVRSQIFQNGELVLSEEDKEYPELSKIPDKLISFLNFFTQATPDESAERFVRELVKQSVAEIVGFDAATDGEKFEQFVRERDEREKINELELSESKRKKRRENLMAYYRKIARINLDWAEVNAWSEQRWSGAAARNDTGYRGYDAWTKMYVQYYRERQSGPRTAGPIGNPEDMQIIRMASPDMWLAIRTESGEAVQEIFDEIHDINRHMYKLEKDSLERKQLENRKKEAYEKLKFPRWTESDWASNGLNRQAQVWHNIMGTEDINFNEIVKRDNWGILKFDRAKFEEIVKDDFLKKRRYAFSSNNAMNYGALTRMRERVKLEFNPDGTVKENSEKYAFKDKYLAEAMFGEIVIGSIRREWFDGELTYTSADEKGKSIKLSAPKKNEKFDPNKHGTFQGYLNSAGAREKILKNVCKAGLAAQLRAHRQMGGLDERWDNHAVRKFYAALRSMPQYIEDPKTGKEVEIPNAQFFSEEDIKWIRKHSGTTKGKLLVQDLGLTMADLLTGAFPSAFKAFWSDITSDIAA